MKTISLSYYQHNTFILEHQLDVEIGFEVHRDGDCELYFDIAEEISKTGLIHDEYYFKIKNIYENNKYR